MDDMLNINNQQEGSEAKRWHFDVSGISASPAQASPASQENVQYDEKVIVGQTVEKAEEKSEESPSRDRSEAKENRNLRTLLKNNKITRKGLRQYVPWIFMLIICFAVLIFNRYRIEDLVKEKNDTQERIKYLREHRIQMQKVYQESTKISKIAEELDTLGIGLLSGPPYEINNK